jgi:hypothetical protein
MPEIKTPKVKPTVKSPERIAFPGIYGNPAKIAAEAASRVAPESPNLKRLFGVTRDDLMQIAHSREGNLPGALPGAAANPRGSEAAEKVMTPKNVQRILDVNAEATKHPELVRGMDPWYVMDPFYNRMVQLLGKDEAIKEYRKMNILSGMASPGSEVMTEIPRGSAAYFLQKQGRWPEFMKSVAIPQKDRAAAGVAEDIIGVPGHVYHRTAQADPMDKYLKSGQFTMTTPKVPLYIESSGVPDTGFQTRTPVGDAHWSRAVGLGDTRTSQNFGASVSNPEMTQLAPWWREKIAQQLGIESVPAQARTWGAFSGQTGVTTPIGSPKLEMIADQIMDTAKRLGVSPETARDMVMTGEARIGKKDGGLINDTLHGMVKSPKAAEMFDLDLAKLALAKRQGMADGGQMHQPSNLETKGVPFDQWRHTIGMHEGGDNPDAVHMEDGGFLQNAYRSIVPAHLRTFGETLLGDRSPITEKNFTPEELAQMREVIDLSRQERMKENKTAFDQKLLQMYRDKAPNKEIDAYLRAGVSPQLDQTVGYQHYPNDPSDWTLGSSGAIRNTLGKFAYKKDPEGNLIATDLYKFRDDLPKETRPTADYEGMTAAEKLGTIAKDSAVAGGFWGIPSRIGNAFLGNTEGRPVEVNLGKASFARGGAAKYPSPEEMLIELMERRHAKG